MGRRTPDLPGTAVTLEELGWTPELATAFAAHEPGPAGALPARVAADHGVALEALGESGPRDLILPGKMRKKGVRPAVGDWVAIRPEGSDRGVVEALLPRRTRLARRAAGGEGGEQLVAANIDVAFIVAPLDRAVNPRWMERALALVAESGARPVVCLTKADLHEGDAAAGVAAGGARVIVTAALEGRGLTETLAEIGPGQTAVLLGASGAGKSTLVNALLGREVLATAAVREADGRGRHTTTHRQLLLLPGGGMIVDTPGVRELGLLDTATEARDVVFAEVVEAAGGCHYADCTHEHEPGCAVLAALAAGTLDPARVSAWQKLRREQAHDAAGSDARARLEEKRRGKVMSKALKKMYEDD